MSFQNQGFWMTKSPGCMNNGEGNYDSSSGTELKRSHQWFMDGPEAEFFPSKRQAVEVPASNCFTGMLNSNVSPWGNPSGFQSISGHFAERIFDSEAAQTVNFDNRNIPSVSSEKVNTERKVDEDPFGNDFSFGLSMSHALEGHRSGLNYGGIRKVKVSQVKDSENIMLAPMEHAYNRMDNNTMSTVHTYDKTDGNTMSMGLAYNKGVANIMSLGETNDEENSIFISMRQPFSDGDDNLSISRTYKENNTMTMDQNFNKDDNNIISMGQPYNKSDESTISAGNFYTKGSGRTMSLSQTYKGENNNLSIGQSYSKGESTIISFGGCDDDDVNPSGSLIASYDLLMGQSSLQRSETVNGKELVKLNADVLVSTSHMAASGNENSPGKKEDIKTSKKVPPNSFPSNVRSLLSTGMLDGVPVKYVAWSREKELPGVIKGSGYLCGCQTCNFSKVINAYEFERHASCKTKHPNNHIYFENGKTIYGVVQDLRSTPQSMLFEVMQTITGSPINQKSFRLWKESFLAATRELQRIYGKDEGKAL